MPSPGGISPQITQFAPPESSTPRWAVKLNEFQASEAKNTTLPPRVRELVIIAVGAVWLAEYELYAQVNVARKTGLSDDAVATLASGGVPEDLSEEEKIAARLAFELMSRHRVDDELYREAEQAFGRTGLFDILTVMGEYQTVCSMMALFEVPVPGVTVTGRVPVVPQI